MSSQQTSLYIKIEKNSVVRDRNVRLSDVAKMTGTDTPAKADEDLFLSTEGEKDRICSGDDFIKNN